MKRAIFLIIAVTTILSMLLTACGAPKVVEKVVTQVVEKTVVQTQMVEKQVIST